MAEAAPPLLTVCPEAATLTVPASCRPGDFQLLLNAPADCENVSRTDVVGNVDAGWTVTVVVEDDEPVKLASPP
jgi:hypothetical protein